MLYTKITVQTTLRIFTVRGYNLFLIRQGRTYRFYQWKNWIPNKVAEYQILLYEGVEKIIYD